MLPKRKKGWDKNQQSNNIISNEVNVSNTEVDNTPVLNEIDTVVKVSNRKALIRIYYNNNNRVKDIAWLEEHQSYNEEDDVEEYYYESIEFTINKILELHLLDIKELVNLSTDDVQYYPIYTDLLVKLVELERQVSSVKSDIDEVSWDNLNDFINN